MELPPLLVVVEICAITLEHWLLVLIKTEHK